MHQLIENLKASIFEDFHIECTHKTIEICESARDATCNKVTFKVQSKPNIFAFSLDKKMKNSCKVFSFYTSVEGLQKVNDAILFYKNGSDFFVLLIEMKSNKPGDYLKQLRAARNFSKYLIETLNITFSKSYTLKEENIRCILFDVRKSPSKTGTKRENVKYDNRNGLNVVNEYCNQEYVLEKYFCAI